MEPRLGNRVSENDRDVFTAGDLYEPYVGRWSRLVARDFLSWLRISAQREWLDIGCGTGALSQVILDNADPRSVRGIDPSEGFVEYARAHTPSPLASFEIGDAQSLPLDTASVDATVSALALNFVPGPSAGAAEMARVTRPGGVVAAYVWDYAGKMELMQHFWSAAAALEPTASELDEGPRFPICAPEPLANLFEGAGLRDVQVEAIDLPMHFRDFDDYWSPFLGGVGPAPAYAMSLSEDDREALRDRLRSQLPISDDGSIDLIARAWAVRGSV